MHSVVLDYPSGSYNVGYMIEDENSVDVYFTDSKLLL